MTHARLEPTPDDAAITARHISRLVRWMIQAGDAVGNPVTVPAACGIAMRATQDYLHFGPAATPMPEGRP